MPVHLTKRHPRYLPLVGARAGSTEPALRQLLRAGCPFVVCEAGGSGSNTESLAELQAEFKDSRKLTIWVALSSSSLGLSKSLEPQEAAARAVDLIRETLTRHQLTHFDALLLQFPPSIDCGAPSYSAIVRAVWRAAEAVHEAGLVHSIAVAGIRSAVELTRLDDWAFVKPAALVLSPPRALGLLPEPLGGEAPGIRQAADSEGSETDQGQRLLDLAMSWGVQVVVDIPTLAMSALAPDSSQCDALKRLALKHDVSVASVFLSWLLRSNVAVLLGSPVAVSAGLFLSDVPLYQVSPALHLPIDPLTAQPVLL